MSTEPKSLSETSTAGPDGGPLLVVISGPSCAGKDSVLARLRERGYPAHFTVTATTRPKREVRPEDHELLRFLSEEEFDELLKSNGLLEHAEVYGYHYGVPKAPLQEALDQGKNIIMRVDVQGAETIKRLVPAAVLIFLMLSSIDEIEARLRARGQDDEATLQKRLKAAVGELKELPKFDYVVVNKRDCLDETVDTIEAILLAERCRIGRARVSI
ncbi:MAG: guanylate kinase [Chloroflexi bacterium]|nr:guanylate kinase [Chloroflexota bacterium]